METLSIIALKSLSGSGGGGGTTDYNALTNKPSIGSVSLQGNKTLADLNLYSKTEIDALLASDWAVDLLPAPEDGKAVFLKTDGVIYESDGTGWSKASSAILDSASLDSIAHPSAHLLYRVEGASYFHSGTRLDSEPQGWKCKSGISASSDGIADASGAVGAWDSLTPAIVNGLADQSDWDDADFFSYGNPIAYDYKNTFTKKNFVNLYHNPSGQSGAGNFVLISSTDDAASYDSLTNKPTVNSITFAGNQTSESLRIMREVSQDEYDALSDADKNNGTAYLIDGSSVAGNVNETDYANLTNKPSLNGITLRAGMVSSDLDLYTRAQMDAKLSSVMSFKGVLSQTADLPSSNSHAGDVYYITSESASFIYSNSMGWQSMGSGSIDLTAYQTVQDNTLETSSKTIVGAINSLNADKQNKTDNTLETTSKQVIGAINENKSNIDLRQLTSNLITTVDSSSDDTHYPSAKAIYAYSSPLQSSFVEMNVTTVSPDDCVFDFDRAVSDVNSREFAVRKYFCALNDSITGNLMYGDLTVEEQAYGGNLQVRQTFNNFRLGDYNSRKVFFRTGYCIDASIPETSIYSNRSNITWNAWYPLEYPSIALTGNPSVLSGTGTISCSISGGIMDIEIADILFKTFSSTDSATQTIINSIPNLPIKARYGSSNAFRCWGVIQSAVSDKSKIISIPNSYEVLAFNVKDAGASAHYYGQLIVPLGY